MRSRYNMILISLIPAAVFLIVYRLISFRIAVIVGFGLGAVIYAGKYLRDKKLTAFDYLGIFGLLSQTAISIIAKNPKTYFIYPLLENVLYALVFGISLVIGKDIVSYLAKDFCASQEAFKRCKPAYRMITFAWLWFYIVKAAVKLVGLSSWSFEVLYVIDWFLGTPVGIALLWFSLTYPDRYYKNKYGNTSNAELSE